MYAVYVMHFTGYTVRVSCRARHLTTWPRFLTICSWSLAASRLPLTMSRRSAQGNDIRLKHKFASPPESGRAVPLSVIFQEQHWSYADAQRARTGALVDREHLMMALADLEYIIIKAAPDDSAQQSA